MIHDTYWTQWTSVFMIVDMEDYWTQWTSVFIIVDMEDYFLDIF